MSVFDLKIPQSFEESDSFLADLDACLLNGFARLGDTEKATLHGLRDIFSGSPLGTSLADTVESFGTGRFSDEGFSTIAAARNALLGAQYDALCAEITEKLGVEFLPVPPVTYAAVRPNIFDSCKSWLSELAIGGFRQVEQASIAPFRATLETLLQEPRAVRLSALLTGFISELETCAPMSAMTDFPTRRWADLWSRAVLGTRGMPEVTERERIEGQLFLLGTDIREQSHGVRLRVYGILCRDEKTPQLVCINRFAFKVPTITSFEIWKLFEDSPKLLQALVNWQSFRITSMALTADGNLSWDESCAEPDASQDPFESAAEYLPCAQMKIAAVDRHPVQIATPVAFDSLSCAEIDGELLVNETLPLTFQGSGSAALLNPEVIKKAEACIALLRFDGGRWELQPLTLKISGKTTEIVHNGAAALGEPPKKKKSGKAAAKKKKTPDSLEILRERAGKLLRK